MGNYIYRLRGTSYFTEELIDNKLEKVYDLVFWYKESGSSFWRDKMTPEQKARNMLAARLENAFDVIGYPKFVRHIFIEQDKSFTRDENIMEWNRNSIEINDGSNVWDSLKKFKLNQLAPNCST